MGFYAQWVIEEFTGRPGTATGIHENITSRNHEMLNQKHT